MLEEQWLELESLLNKESVLSKLGNQHVLVICYHGDTARVATSVLRAQGIQADSLRGGYQALRDQGLWGDGGVEEIANRSGTGEKLPPAVSVAPIELTH